MTMLFANDTTLQAISEQITLPALGQSQDVYLALLESIVSQQLSVKAADTIFKRFLTLFENAYPNPLLLQEMSLESLRSVGLSRQKATYLQAVATFHLADSIDFKALETKTETEIITHLTAIKGVGKWTVEMLLIFVLQRPDVLSVDDLGIQHRSLACRYVWRWKDILAR